MPSFAHRLPASTLNSTFAFFYCPYAWNSPYGRFLPKIPRPIIYSLGPGPILVAETIEFQQPAFGTYSKTRQCNYPMACQFKFGTTANNLCRPMCRKKYQFNESILLPCGGCHRSNTMGGSLWPMELTVTTSAFPAAASASCNPSVSSKCPASCHGICCELREAPSLRV